MDTIGIDVGSTNVKAVLVAADGTTLAATAQAVPWAPVGRAAELDAEVLWQAVLAAVAALGAASASGLGAVGAIGLCGQYSSIVPVDRDLRPVAPLRLYLDQRGTPHCQAILERTPDALVTWMDRHPIPPIGGGLALGHLLAFQLDEPAVHERAVAYLEPVDYVTARLTGRATATQASMFASQLIDNRTVGATAYDPDLVALAGVDPDRLPPLVAADAVVGPVRGEVAEVLGLPGGVAVHAGMTDTHAAALATGAATAGRVGLALGTTSVVLATTDRLHADFDHEVLAMPGVRPGEHLVWAENGLAGRVVEHVLEQFVHPTDELGDHRGDPAAGGAFAGFEAALAASTAGAGGVRFLPWLAGSMAPQADGAMRGGFVGVSLASTRVDLVRAAVEGVAHNLRWLLGPVAAFAGEEAGEAVLIGGPARSPGWCQVLADVLALPLRTVAEPGHAGARAVAAWAARGGVAPDAVTDPSRGPGLGSDWATAYEPDAAATAVHDAAHAQFVAAFDALRPLRLGSRPR